MRHWLILLALSLLVAGCAASEFAWAPAHCYQFPKYAWDRCPFPERAWKAGRLPAVGYDGTRF